MIRFHVIPVVLLFCAFISSCGSDGESTQAKTQINIRLVEEPDRIHPMLSTSSVSTQIENHLLLPLMEFDPKSLELTPMLVSERPVISNFRKGKKFNFQLREDAVWSDGTPITAKDYEFTVKAAINPHTASRAWRGFLSEIDSVWINPNDPKNFEVFIDDAFHLALETAANFNVYSHHFYDPKGLLDDYSIAELKTDSLGGRAQQFGVEFARPSLSRDSIISSGPYVVDQWEPNLFVELVRNENYRLPYPKAYPDRLTYQIVPDEATALSMLRGEKLDIVTSVSPSAFSQLQKEAPTDFDYLTPSIMQYYYLCLNTTNQKLGDFKVRRALAHTLDLSLLIEKLMEGLAEPIAGPTHPGKPHYNKNLSIIKKDLARARQLLDQAGWKDDNGDGIREKAISGKMTNLSLEVLVTQRELGRNLARILKENAKEIGIEIIISSMEWAQIVQRMASRNFDIIPMAKRQSPGLDDHYGMWHTESIGPDGRNIAGFGNQKSDSIIVAIRNEMNLDKRNDLYREFQEVVYNEQPVIFLFAPTQQIITSKNWKVEPSIRRPGYFENLAEKR